VAGIAIAAPLIRNVATPRADTAYAAARTLAVLPPAGFAGDTTDRYLADGMAGELTARLAKLRRLRVKGPRAAAAAGGAGTPQAVGEILGVDYLVESRIQRRDSVLVVSLRLIDAREGFQLWSEAYRFGERDLLELQDSIARDVAGAVAGELSVGERATLAARLTTSPAAYDHYLRGNYLLAKRTPASVGEAMEAFGTALELDRRFAEAHAQAGYARIVYADWGWPPLQGRSGAELVNEARVLVDRAIALDPRSPVVWLARAYLQVVSDPYRFEGAVAAFERSLRLDSLNPEAHHQYGQTLMPLGRYAEADAAYRRALELDPVRPITLVPLAAIARQQGRNEDAIRWADSAVAVTRFVPAPYALAVRAHLALSTGDVAQAIAEARRALDLDASYPAPALAVLAEGYARTGDTAAAASALSRLLGALDLERPTPTDVRFAASALFATGRIDDALTLVERAEPRGAQLWYYLQSRDFDDHRDHPRFQAVSSAADPR
jgi:TolB-like protein/Tfp pilus assembly protein PilF